MWLGDWSENAKCSSGSSWTRLRHNDHLRPLSYSFAVCRRLEDDPSRPVVTHGGVKCG
jgi:hypothetical protein